MRKINKPSSRDLAIWKEINEDLLDWLYKGLTGRFQIAGHRLIDKWAQSYIDNKLIEIGCGHGHHLRYGKNDYKKYIGLDVEKKFLYTLRDRFPGTSIVNGSAYELPFHDHSINCVLSVYCFEHLHNLADCLLEVHRVLKPEGEFLVALPTEGGLLYWLGRRFTSKPYMEKKYGIDYNAIVKWEHWNTFNQIIEMLKRNFKIKERRFIPFPFFPTMHANVIGCIRLKPNI